MRYSPSRIAVLGAWLFLLSGCGPISLTMLGVGSGAGVAHTLGGIAYKTFTETMPKVKKATLAKVTPMARVANKTPYSAFGFFTVAAGTWLLTKYNGRLLLSSNMRPRYSPITPRVINCTPPRNRMATISEG